MTSDQFNAAFSNIASQSLPPIGDPAGMASEILRRDRLRIRLLAATAIIFWLAGMVGMLLLVFALNDFVMFVRLGGGQAHTEMAWAMGTQLIHHSLPWVAGGIVALLLAAICTILLILTSRQATLTNINISLWQIAQQMKSTAGSATIPQQSTSPVSQTPNISPVKLDWTVFLVIIIVVFVIVVPESIRLLKPDSSGQTFFWQGYPRLAPYQAIQWRGNQPEVQVAGKWYDLLGINNVFVDQIISKSRSLDPATWQKHFNEDLVELMTKMGDEPGTQVDLSVKDLSTGATAILKNVPMTESNRRAIFNTGVHQAPSP